MSNPISSKNEVGPSVEEKIRRAVIHRYDHGGGRMYFEDGEHRELIADFYGDGEFREYILAKLQHSHEPGAVSRVFVLCNASESGYGHGLAHDDLVNPYTPGGEEHEAYSIGQAAGSEVRKSRSAQPPELSLTQEWLDAMQAYGVPQEPLDVYDSNSWRRVGLKSRYLEILWPFCNPTDGHVDIHGANTLRALVAAFNAMLAAAQTTSPAAAQPPGETLAKQMVDLATAGVLRDAERYRWLRDQRRWYANTPPAPGINIKFEYLIADDGEKLDEAIDAKLRSAETKEVQR